MLGPSLCQARSIEWFWSRRFLHAVNLCDYFPLKKKSWPFIWTNLNPLYATMRCAKFGWNWLSTFSLVLLKKCHCNFWFFWFCYYLPLIKDEQTINSIHPGMLYAKFVLNIGLVVIIENLRFILKYCVSVISLLNMYLPLGSGLVIHLKKIESPSFKYVLSSLKLDRWFWRRRFLNFFRALLLFHYYFPLKKSLTLHLK